MAQLSNDCFALGDEALTIEAARREIEARLSPVEGVEIVALAEADGRVLAEDVRAREPLPPFFNSAVDGYAVRHADLDAAGPTRLPVRGRLQAGAEPMRLETGTAARIFTGAAMPAGADTVFMQEDAEADGDAVVLPPGLARGANARPAGEEMEAGAIALPAGRRLRPQDVGLAAAVGAKDLAVRRRLRVALFSTGDELVEAGAPLRPGAVRDANRPLLAALLRRAGADVTDGGILRDEPEALRVALAEAAEGHDLLVTSAGVSTGEADHVKAAVSALGRLDHWRFAIKPGRPLAMGVVAGTPFVGLPGNPVAAYVTFTQVVAAVVARLSGSPFHAPRAWPVRAGFSTRKKGGRREFLRVSIEDDGTDASGLRPPVARRFPIEGAGILSSLTKSDGLVVLPEDVTRVEQGELLAFLPFETLA